MVSISAFQAEGAGSNPVCRSNANIQKGVFEIMDEVKVHIATSKIWPYFQANRTRLAQNEDLIAENKKTGFKLYLSTYGTYPYFVVYDELDFEVIRKTAYTQEECSAVSVFLIGNYIVAPQNQPNKEPKKEVRDEVNPDIPPPSEEDEEQKINDTIYQREDELTLAMADFLAVACGEDDAPTILQAYGVKMVNDALDHFLQYMYDEHKLSIYRPSILQNEKGEDEYCEFPYGWYDE